MVLQHSVEKREIYSHYQKYFVKLIYSYFFQVLGAIGGIFALALSGPGFWSFIYWSTAIISALFIALRVFNIMPALEQRFAFMSKVVSHTVKISKL